MCDQSSPLNRRLGAQTEQTKEKNEKKLTYTCSRRRDCAQRLRYRAGRTRLARPWKSSRQNKRDVESDAGSKGQGSTYSRSSQTAAEGDSPGCDAESQSRDGIHHGANPASAHRGTAAKA